MLLVAWPLGGKYATIGSGSASQCAVRSCLRLLCLCGGYVLYLVLGAAVFSALEVPGVDSNLAQLSAARTKLQRAYPMVQGMYTQTWTNSSKILRINMCRDYICWSCFGGGGGGMRWTYRWRMRVDDSLAVIKLIVNQRILHKFNSAIRIIQFCMQFRVISPQTKYKLSSALRVAMCDLRFILFAAWLLASESRRVSLSYCSLYGPATDIARRLEYRLGDKVP